MTTQKVPREALADILRRVAQHVEQYHCEVSVAFDGSQYRVSVTGDGEKLFQGKP